MNSCLVASCGPRQALHFLFVFNERNCHFSKVHFVETDLVVRTPIDKYLMWSEHSNKALR